MIRIIIVTCDKRLKLWEQVSDVAGSRSKRQMLKLVGSRKLIGLPRRHDTMRQGRRPCEWRVLYGVNLKVESILSKTSIIPLLFGSVLTDPK